MRADQGAIANARAARVGCRRRCPSRLPEGQSRRRRNRKAMRKRGGRALGVTPVSGVARGHPNSDRAARVREEGVRASSAVARAFSARAGDGAGGIGRRGGRVGVFVRGVEMAAEESVPRGDNQDKSRRRISKYETCQRIREMPRGAQGMPCLPRIRKLSRGPTGRLRQRRRSSRESRTVLRGSRLLPPRG